MALSGLEVPLEIVGLEVMAEGIWAGTHLEVWRERIPDCSSCNAETVGTRGGLGLGQCCISG